VIDSPLTYDGLTPVSVRVSRRDRRYTVSDEGGAVRAAGVKASRLAFPDHIDFGDRSVNVSRQGVVFLPAVAPSEEWLETLRLLVAQGSIALYEELLELDRP
jgi:hypothetical protein